MKKSALKGLKLRQLSSMTNGKSLITINQIGVILRNIRETLGMTQAQLAKKLGVKQPVISRIEENATSSSLKTLERLATALECEFKGAVVSKIPLEDIIKRQAEKAAKRLLKRTYANMAMEKQAPNDADYNYQFKKLVDELIADPGPELWEE